MTRRGSDAIDISQERFGFSSGDGASYNDGSMMGLEAGVGADTVHTPGKLPVVVSADKGKAKAGHQQ